MKILKSNIFKKRNCEFGSFELVPEEGWKISRSFIDFESRLLIVSESDDNQDNWIDQGAGIRKIPNKQYIIDPKKGEILTCNDWSKHFNYETIEVISEDGIYKMLTTRVHDPEINSDSIQEELIDLKSGKTILTSRGIAFRKDKRKNLIEARNENIQRANEYKEQLEFGEYPVRLQLEHIENLKANEIVIEFYDDNQVYQLTYLNKYFSLGQTDKPKTAEDWKNYKVITTHNFPSISEFWSFLSNQDVWFEKFTPRKINCALHRNIIKYHNELILTSELTYQQYSHLHQWMNLCWDDSLNRNIYWQLCSNCKNRVLYNPRYPKHACQKCVDLIVDENGNKLNYQSTHELIYLEGKERLVLKDMKTEVKIYINNDEYWPSEAKFGGIVHQKKENNTI